VAGEDTRVPRVGCKGTQKMRNNGIFVQQLVYENGILTSFTNTAVHFYQNVAAQDYSNSASARKDMLSLA